MTSPARRREAAKQAQTTLEVSERRACQVIGQPRSTQRYAPRLVDDEAALIQRMHELVRLHPRFGYRRIWPIVTVETDSNRSWCVR